MATDDISMKPSVMMSIKPKYCELIAAGKKTIEVRKTKPRIETPFKCYIYCTLPKERYSIGQGNCACSDNLYLCDNKVKFGEGFEDIGNETTSLNGKIIGEFVCDEILCFPYVEGEEAGEYVYNIPTVIGEQTCLDYGDVSNYGNGKSLYFWHISNLVIYDEPKELSKFYTWCPEYERAHITSKCGRCRHISFNEFDRYLECDCKGEKKLTRPPQSWYYVVEGR